MWEQHCYDSVLAGKAASVAGRQHRQSHGVGDLPQVPRLLPPHRRPGPGGRDGELSHSFRAPGLDPIHYVTPPCCGAQPARLPFTSSPASRAELHLPALRSSQQFRAGQGGLITTQGARQLDLVLGLQCHAPGRNDAAQTVALPEKNAATLGDVPLWAGLGVRFQATRARPLGLTWRSALASPRRPARSSCPSLAARRGGRGRQAAGRAGRQDLEAAQSLPLRLQRKDALLEAERSHQRRRIELLELQLLGEEAEVRRLKKSFVESVDLEEITREVSYVSAALDDQATRAQRLALV